MTLKIVDILRDRLVGITRSVIGCIQTMSPRSKLLFRGSALFFPLVVAILTIVLPLCTQRSLPSASRDESNRGIQQVTGTVTDTLKRLLVEEEFLKSRLTLAKTDSICLVIDLPGAVTGLDLHGCRLRNSHIVRTTLSARIRRSKRAALAGWLAGPFSVEKEWSTIPKMPIKIKRAPRDSIQASKMSMEPRPVEKEDVHFRLFCDRDLVIDIEQAQPASSKGLVLSLFSGTRAYVDFVGETFSSLFRGRIPHHYAMIRVQLDQNDARAVYRAIPHHAGVLVRL